MGAPTCLVLVEVDTGLDLVLDFKALPVGTDELLGLSGGSGPIWEPLMPILLGPSTLLPDGQIHVFRQDE